MVTATHETAHRIFQEHPEVLAPAFEALGLPPPVKADIEVLSPDVTELRPMERRVDTVLRIASSAGDDFIVAVETQTRRAPDKEANWAYYVAYLRAKFDLPVLLVAVCKNRSTASWAIGPFECRVGPWITQATRPFVLGPDTVPEITDESMMAQKPALATFTAIVHSESPNIDAILDMLARGMRSFDLQTAMYWCQFLEVGLENTPARESWRGLQKMVATFFPGRGTLIEETYLQGEAEGEAKGRIALILRTLEKREIGVPEEAHERITSCTDLDQLTTWFDRALTADSAADLFTGDPEASADGPHDRGACG
ncbi:hypothetical protein A8713_16205 [Streptomyces sp. SAT1]|uniref:hypothetical protein n=1 Tax=Streptomyces sp. SAT1 TaxID=1849967 RepID=UPI0007DCE589|nr:hypothetical protein [Streptomyces sp. SAT1]ANH92511.1 hypothetical protein A8713_16205 [Streptomyces sp. SAT1]